MKKQYWTLVVVTLLVVFCSTSNAGFIVAEDADAPAPFAPVVVKTQPTIVSPSDAGTLEAKPESAPVDKQAERPTRLKKPNEYRANYGDRVAVQHKGRKPAVFGRQVHFYDQTLGEAITILMPESFQAYNDEDVDMNTVVDGSDSTSWVSGLDYALKGTPYIAEIDWDKKEINLSKDKKIKEIEAAKAEKLKEIETAKAAKQAQEAAKLAQDAAKKQEDEKKAERLNRWSVSRQDGLLSLTLEKWCKNSNGQCVQFLNQSLHDVPVDSDAEFEGTFKQAVTDLMGSIEQHIGRRFRWQLTSNNVLILTDDLIKD